MIVPPMVPHALAFVFRAGPQGDRKPIGTATIFHVPLEPQRNTSVMTLPGGLLFAVTARHVIEDARRRTTNDYLLLRIGTDPSSGHFYRSYFDEWIGHEDDEQEPWLEANDGPRVDVAVAPVDPDMMLGGPAIPLSWSASHKLHTDTDDPMTIGQDVAILGLFSNHYGHERNIPILRSGVIAATVSDGVPTGLGPMSAFLVEARSTGGLSGAPAFWVPGRYRWGADGLIAEVEAARFALMGFIHGHFDDQRFDGPINRGIAVVTPVRYAEEIIAQERFQAVLRRAQDLWVSSAGDTLVMPRGYWSFNPIRQIDTFGNQVGTEYPSERG